MGRPPPLANVHIPLEILVNLIYLTKLECTDPEKVTAYMITAEQQMSKLTVMLELSPER